MHTVVLYLIRVGKKLLLHEYMSYVSETAWPVFSPFFVVLLPALLDLEAVSMTCSIKRYWC